MSSSEIIAIYLKSYLFSETSFKYLGAAIGIPLVLILLVIFILAAQIRYVTLYCFSKNETSCYFKKNALEKKYEIVILLLTISVIFDNYIVALNDLMSLKEEVEWGELPGLVKAK